VSPTAPPLLRELIACPSCRHPLVVFERALNCGGCSVDYDVVDSVPILLPSSAEGASTLKQTQATYFDEEVDEEFEITRPHATPALYSWLMDYKFQRGVSDLTDLIQGSSALAVCSGSGMDAEFLARSGARTIALDFSLGAVLRSLERARRCSLPIEGVVGDVEALPFPDASVDIVYVHDGLHHLADPLSGLREMLRVARLGVSVNEPADALGTRLAVRLGLAVDVEPAGNPVARVSVERIASYVEAAGFEVSSGRYVMYYKHHPGRVVAALSREWLFPLATLAFRGLNRMFGRAGNKSFVQGRRLSRRRRSEH
jgi:SAM-dependent methyltransferase